MEFIEFEGMHGTLNKNHEDGFRPLPFRREIGRGEWMICCQFDDEEIERMKANGGRLFFQIACGERFYPVLPVMADLVAYPTDFNGRLVWYQEMLQPGETGVGQTIQVYCRGEITQLPQDIEVYNGRYRRTAAWQCSDVQPPEFWREMPVGSLYFVMAAGNRVTERMERWAAVAESSIQRLPEQQREGVRQRIRESARDMPFLVSRGMESNPQTEIVGHNVLW